MSALQLRKVKQTSLETDSCLTTGCNRKGRHAVSLAGHPVLSQERMSRGRQSMLCPRCRNDWLKIWAEFSGEQWSGETASAVGSLSGSTTKRTEAIFELRGLGFSPAAVTDAASRAKRGESTEQILQALEDSTSTRELVAA